MSDWFLNSFIGIASFAGMEAVAWFTHKYIMHGVGWFLHKDHHQKHSVTFFEKNDFFFLIFAVPGIIALLTGLSFNLNQLFFVGVGITVYGLIYFLVHDLFIHQRFKIFKKTDSLYLRALRKAHKVHHKQLEKHNATSFGMLWVPFRYFREAFNAEKE